MTNRALLDLLYAFVESACADHGIGKDPTAKLYADRRELRIYARSFIGKQLASEDYGPVLDAIRGRW